MALRVLKGQVAREEGRDFVKGILCSGIWGFWDFHPYKGGKVGVSVPPLALVRVFPVDQKMMVMCVSSQSGT